VEDDLAWLASYTLRGKPASHDHHDHHQREREKKKGSAEREKYRERRLTRGSWGSGSLLSSLCWKKLVA
jgi:hypothetical protein